METIEQDIDVDLFCGGGGASLGIKWGSGRAPAIAVNHNPAAIAMHSINHPDSHGRRRRGRQRHQLEMERRRMSQKIKRIKKVELTYDFGDAGRLKITVANPRGLSGQRLHRIGRVANRNEFSARHGGLHFTGEPCRYFTIEFER